MPEDLVNKNVDVIVDAIEDDGQLKHKEYIVDSSQELFKKHIVLTQNSFETVYYTIYNDGDEMRIMINQSLMKRIFMSMLYCIIMMKETC